MPLLFIFLMLPVGEPVRVSLLSCTDAVLLMGRLQHHQLSFKGDCLFAVLGSKSVGYISHLPSSSSQVVAGTVTACLSGTVDMASSYPFIETDAPKEGWGLQASLAFTLRTIGPQPGFVCTSVFRNFWFCCSSCRSFSPFGTCRFVSD